MLFPSIICDWCYCLSLCEELRAPQALCQSQSQRLRTLSTCTTVGAPSAQPKQQFTKQQISLGKGAGGKFKPLELPPLSGLTHYFSANAVRSKGGTPETRSCLGRWPLLSVSTNLQAGLSCRVYPAHGASFEPIHLKKHGAEVKYGCSRSLRWERGFKVFLGFLSHCCVADSAGSWFWFWTSP